MKIYEQVNYQTGVNPIFDVSLEYQIGAGTTTVEIWNYATGDYMILTSNLNFSGVVTRKFKRIVSGTLNFSGILNKFIKITISGTLIFASQMNKLYRLTISGLLNVSGKVTKKITKFFSGTLSFVPHLSYKVHWLYRIVEIITKAGKSLTMKIKAKRYKV